MQLQRQSCKLLHATRASVLYKGRKGALRYASRKAALASANGHDLDRRQYLLGLGTGLAASLTTLDAAAQSGTHILPATAAFGKATEHSRSPGDLTRL